MTGGEERIKKRILLTLQDGSMYGFDFDIITRISSDYLLLDVENKKEHKYKSCLEIELKGGITNYHNMIECSNKNPDKAFIILIGNEFDSYISYPKILKTVEGAHNVMKNWSINFVDCFLDMEHYEYNYEKALQASNFWEQKNSLLTIQRLRNIEKIEFAFRSKN